MKLNSYYFCIFYTWRLLISTCLHFWSYYNWLISKEVDTIHYRNTILPPYFYIFYVRWLVFYEHCIKNFKTFQKNVSIPRMDEKKLHTGEFQLKRIDRNVRCKLLLKSLAGKTTLLQTLATYRHRCLEHSIAFPEDLFWSNLKLMFPPITFRWNSRVRSFFSYILGIKAFFWKVLKFFA